MDRSTTHRGGGALDLVLTNIPELFRVAVGGAVGRSGHSHVWLLLDTSVRVPGFAHLGLTGLQLGLMSLDFIGGGDPSECHNDS